MSSRSDVAHLGFLDRIRLPGSARHLAVVRIAFCVHVLTVLMSPAMPMLYRLRAGTLPWTHTLFPAGLENLVADHLARPLLNLGVVAGLMGVFGLATRLVMPILFVSFLMTQNLWFRSSLFHDDWLYFCFFLLVLCFARSGDALSIDGWVARRRGRVPKVDSQAYRWPTELMMLWFSSLYIAAAIAKVFPLRKAPLWFSGSRVQNLAAQFLLESPIHWWFGRTAFDYTLRWPFTVAAVLTVYVELSAVVLVLTHRLRWTVLFGILGLHVMVYLVGIPGFVQVSLVSMLLFLSPEAFRDYGGNPSRAGGPQ